MHIVNSGRCAIVTRYYGPTNHRGARIKVWTSGGRKPFWISYYKADEKGFYRDESPHFAAVREYCAKMGWDYDLTAAATDDGYIFTGIAQ